MADQFYGLTDTGKIRGNNEDTFIAQEIWNKKLTLASVIDGVGGYSGGEIAAEIARETIIEYLETPSQDLISIMKEAFVAAHQKIEAEKERQPKYERMACVLTLALVDIENNVFHYAHLGDTRLYLLRDHSLVKVTKDHSFVGYLEESGRLTEDAAMQHPKRNEINKALGFGNKFSSADDYIETGESPFLTGDLLLLCSDGLTDLVNKGDITAILTSETSLREKAEQLIDAANNKGGKDNITVVLVENNKAAQKQELTKPAEAIKRTENPVIQEEIKPTNYISVTDPETAINHPPLAKLPVKNDKRLITILSILSTLLFIATLVLLWQLFKPDEVKAQASTAKTRNAEEIKLQDALNKLTGDTLILSASDFPEPIVISDTILIQQDSLFIKTKGRIALTADPAYKGPGLVLATTSKFISIDSLILENFKTGISVYNNALHLKNVLFTNCQVPVQTSFIFEDNRYVSGSILNESFKKDSIPQKRLK
ncbi:MAG: hypothetical protein JWQ25_90 [Daejeonella sp.]|nr:hypothetical protein [Daejeonella sp.]